MPADIASLVAERQQIRAYLEGEQKRFNEHCKPYNEKIQKLDAQLTEMMTQQGVTSVKTDVGTAILSRIDNMSIVSEERDAFIDWCLDNWDEYGGEMMQIGKPKVDAVRSYMDANGGQLPPHIKKETTIQFSIRKA